VKAKCVAILDTMWGGSGKAPGMFRINPKNHTGRRLYWFLGHKDLWVTNACTEYVANAKLHGRPDPKRLATNLQRVTCDLLLVCGSVAAKAFRKCGYKPKCRVIYIPHPAWRGWTMEHLEEVRRRIQDED